MYGVGLAIHGFNRAHGIALSGYSNNETVLTLYAAMSYEAVLLNFVTPIPSKITVSGGGRSVTVSGGGRRVSVRGGGRTVTVSGGGRR